MLLKIQFRIIHFRKYDPLICFALGQAGEVIRAIVSGLHKKKPLLGPSVLGLVMMIKRMIIES